MAAHTTEQNQLRRLVFAKIGLPPWIAEYVDFFTLGAKWALYTKFWELTLLWIFKYQSGFKTRLFILWILWGGGLFGPFNSCAMRPIAQDFLAWFAFDEPDAPPAVTCNSLLKVALFFLPSTTIFFDIFKWPQTAFSIVYCLFWGWPLYLSWLSVLHEFTGIGAVVEIFFKRIQGKTIVVIIYFGIMILQMWYASNFGANLSIPFCAPTWLLSSWIFRNCSRIPSALIATISLVIVVQAFFMIPQFKSLLWALKSHSRRYRLEPSFPTNSHLEDFRYLPLEAGQIRVLVISRQTSSMETAKTRLRHVLINETKYDAISYVWGHQPTFRYLEVDGKRLKVTAKAFQIIEDRKSRFQDQTIWIDSVCINQSNNIEKSQQVGVMCDIYRSARRTIVWLDPMEDPMEGADAAFSLLESIAFRISKWTSEPDDSQLALKRYLYGQIMQNDFRQRALVRLFNQQYFLRTWIVQEIVFSKIIHIRCSGSWLSWDKLATAILTVHHQKYLGLLMSSDIMRGIQQAGVLGEIGWLCQAREMLNTPRGFKPFLLSDVLSQFSFLQVTDPRDRIFGILNLTTAKGEPELVPDYSENVGAVEVFKRTGAYLLRARQMDEVLYSAGIGYPRRTPNLPSWLPDWTSQPTTKHLRFAKSLEIYHASGTRPSSMILLDPDTISVSGVTFDRLATITDSTFAAIDQPGDELYNSKQAMVQQYFLDIEIQKILDMSSTYTATRQSTREALRRTLIGDTLRDLEEPMFSRPADLSKWQSAIETWEYTVQAFKDSKLASNAELLLHSNRQSQLEEELKHFLESLPYRVRLGWGMGVKYFTIARICTAGRKFAITKKGYMALVPPLSKVGDKVCVLYGLEVPFILRPYPDGPSGECYQLVGETYVHGLMDGEALQTGAEEMMFRIR